MRRLHSSASEWRNHFGKIRKEKVKYWVNYHLADIQEDQNFKLASAPIIKKSKLMDQYWSMIAE